jgi:hypothetical protein
MNKKSRSGSGMNIPYHVSESLETIFGFNSLLRMRIRIRDTIIFLTLDPGWKKFGSGTKQPEYETLAVTFLDFDAPAFLLAYCLFLFFF